HQGHSSHPHHRRRLAAGAEGDAPLRLRKTESDLGDLIRWETGNCPERRAGGPGTAVAHHPGMTRTNALLSAVLFTTLAACGRDPAIPADARDLAMAQVGFAQSYSSTQFNQPARL